MREHGVAVEINADPWRLDLDWRWHETALKIGCMMLMTDYFRFETLWLDEITSILPHAPASSGLDNSGRALSVRRPCAPFRLPSASNRFPGLNARPD